MTEATYNASTIIKLPFPEFEKNSKGFWQRKWHINFVNAEKLPLGKVEYFINRYQDKNILIEVVESSNEILILYIKSHDHAGSDNVMLATYKLFLNIDQGLKKISNIEGVDKNKWPGFREHIGVKSIDNNQ